MPLSRSCRFHMFLTHLPKYDGSNRTPTAIIIINYKTRKEHFYEIKSIKKKAYTYFDIINSGYPGIFGQEVRINIFNYYNHKSTYRTLYVFLCLLGSLTLRPPIFYKQWNSWVWLGYFKRFWSSGFGNKWIHVSKMWQTQENKVVFLDLSSMFFTRFMIIRAVELCVPSSLLFPTSNFEGTPREFNKSINIDVGFFDALIFPLVNCSIIVNCNN